MTVGTNIRWRVSRDVHARTAADVYVTRSVRTPGPVNNKNVHAEIQILSRYTYVCA